MRSRRRGLTQRVRLFGGRGAGRWHLYNAGEVAAVYGAERERERSDASAGHQQQPATSTTSLAPNSTNCDTGHAEYKGGQGYRESKGHQRKIQKIGLYRFFFGDMRIDEPA